MPLSLPSLFSPAREPLTIIRDETFVALVSLYLDEAHTQPFSTAGWTFTLTIDKTDIALTAGAGLTPSGHEVLVELTDTQTSSVTVAESHYVLSATKSGAKSFALRGTITWEDA